MVQAGWVATTANYLGRVTKPGILDAVEEACGAEAAARIAGLKKPEMASAAEDLLKGTGWLAHPLRTPVIDEPDGDGELAAANDDGPAIEAGHDELGDDDIDAIAAE
jgi:ParB family chromosome partitioning protein